MYLPLRSRVLLSYYFAIVGINGGRPVECSWMDLGTHREENLLFRHIYIDNTLVRSAWRLTLDTTDSGLRSNNEKIHIIGPDFKTGSKPWGFRLPPTKIFQNSSSSKTLQASVSFGEDVNTSISNAMTSDLNTVYSAWYGRSSDSSFRNPRLYDCLVDYLLHPPLWLP